MPRLRDSRDTASAPWDDITEEQCGNIQLLGLRQFSCFNQVREDTSWIGFVDHLAAAILATRPGKRQRETKPSHIDNLSLD